MRKTVCAILFCALLLSGCAAKESTEATTEPTEEITETESALTEFMNRSYDLDDYIYYTLPEGCYLSDFKADISVGRGCIIKDDALPLKDSDFAPEEWYSPGGIVIFDKNDVLEYDNGELKAVSYGFNHSSHTEPEKIFLNNNLSALLIEYEFDLFTASTWEEYLLTHPEATEEDSVSHYNYIYLASNEKDTGVCVFLNELYFTLADVIDLAKSIVIK